MDTKVNYAVVGLFVILLFAAMAIIFVWLSGFTRHQEYKTYLVYARGGVTGLNLDSPVQFNGVRVGSVSKIELDRVNPQFVKLYLRIEDDTPISQGVVATLVAQGITGLVYVGLRSESDAAPLLKNEPGQPYPIIPYHKPLLLQLSEVLPELTENLGQIAEKFKKLFNDQNLANVDEILTHIEHTTALLEKQSDTIKSSMASLDILLKNGATASGHFDALLASSQQTIQQVKTTSLELNREIDNISQQTMPSLQELIMRLNDTSANMQKLSEDLAANPAVLIRGKKPIPPGPGE